MGMKVSNACLAKFESVEYISTRWREIRQYTQGQLTGLADAKKLIDIPANNTTWDSAPTPFQYAT